MLTRVIVFLLLFSTVAALTRCQQSKTTDSEEAIPLADTMKMEDNLKVDHTWRYKHDLDGDQRPDSITYEYTGGVHCCYEVTAHLTATDASLTLPFSIRGGYMVFDLSQPDNFNIIDIDGDKIFEITVNLEHYIKDRSAKELQELQNQFGFKGSQIIVHLRSGKIKVKDI